MWFDSRDVLQIKDHNADDKRNYRELVKKTGMDPVIFWQKSFFFDVPFAFASINVKVDLEKRYFYGLSNFLIDRSCRSSIHGGNESLDGSLYFEELTKTSNYSVSALKLKDHGSIRITLLDVRTDFHITLDPDSLEVYRIALDNFVIGDIDIHVKRNDGSDFVDLIVDAVMGMFKDRFEEEIGKEINRVAKGAATIINEEKLFNRLNLDETLKTRMNNFCMKSPS
ncbi:hypothetical protein QAD02_023762 [Eretmocerus hayati]|uniref:Uncharacterized protein n=1 Tax=Eretmocerus hayati TaxID=131215 RepID=A0ACC2PWW9_9HYME|nr:hypothetical protein QAD02_023762 [Eretmocerus hayati]